MHLSLGFAFLDDIAKQWAKCGYSHSLTGMKNQKESRQPCDSDRMKGQGEGVKKPVHSTHSCSEKLRLYLSAPLSAVLLSCCFNYLR